MFQSRGTFHDSLSGDSVNPLRRGLIAAIVVLGLFATYVFGMNAKVSWPGNSGIHFAGNVQRGEFESAYDYLCEMLRADITPAEFAAANGHEFAAFREFPGSIFGAEGEYDSIERIDRSIDEAWEDYDMVNPETTQTWRLSLVREGEWLLSGGDWRVCGIEFRGERPTE